VKRITTADVARGEVIGPFQVWPTARPSITLEPGERLAIALRIRANAPDASGLKLGAGAPSSWRLKREASGDHSLEIPIDAATGSSSLTVPLIEEPAGSHPREIRVQLSVTVPAQNIVVTPRELDFGEVALSSATGLVKRIGVRKMVGSFHIKSVSSTLPFLKLEQTTMVDGSNYLIRITFDSTKPLKSGAYNGTLVIETDDGNRSEVPVKLNLVGR
jgi:hypothetical protein